MPRATRVTPKAFTMTPSSTHCEYWSLQEQKKGKGHGNFPANSTRVTSTHPNVQMTFSVRPVTQVAIASMKVTRPKLAWIGTMAERQP